MKKVKTGFQIAYLIAGAAVAGEFLFVRGMFTWLIAVAAIAVLGAVNVVLTARDREWLTSLLYVLCTAALCMGYFVVMNL